MQAWIRGQVCRVIRTVDYGTRQYLQLQALDTGQTFDALCPPEEFQPLAELAPGLDRHALTPLLRWRNLHSAVEVQSPPQGTFAGLIAGRISPEPYQFAPVSRLLAGPRRGLLIADDVGLGKTVEAGLCLLELIARGVARRILLVVPPGLIPQWLDEMWEKFGLKFQQIENASALDRAQTTTPEGLQPWAYFDHVITSTEYLKRREAMAAALAHPWDVVVVDEAHYLAESGTPANPYATARTRLGQKLREATRTLLLLTATPHNGYRHSFRSLLELADPAEASLHGDASAVRRRVGRAMIRRLKPQIVKHDASGALIPAFPVRQPVGRIEVNDMSVDEREIFRLITDYCASTIRASERGDEADLVSFAMQIVKKRMLSSRAALRQTVENRLEALAARQPEAPPKRAELRELQGDLPLSESAADRTAERVLRAAVSRDAKRRAAEKRQLKQVQKLLDRLAAAPDPKIATLIADLEQDVLSVPGEKVIIFTEYRDTLAALREAFAAHPDLRNVFVELTGGLTPNQRRQRIARFHESDCRILLATDAASEGLNLQDRCRRLYHFELPWNPNRLEQRNGRIDRHGQTREPIIRYLFYPHSPEDRVLDKLVQRIATMHDDRVSTPDILGILEGSRIEDVLGGITSAEDAEREGESLMRLFEERREAWARETAPLLVAGTQEATPPPYADPLNADPIVVDDFAFDRLMQDVLRPGLQAGALPGTWSITVPRHLQGSEVLPRYACATFLRSVAARYPADQVEYIHRLHPLVGALSRYALDELTTEPMRNHFAARIAVRRHPLAKQPLALFTYLERQTHPQGRVFAIGTTADGEIVPQDTADRLFTDAETPAGEVSWGECEQVFAANYASLQARAAQEARAFLQQVAQRERTRMDEFAATLREEAALYKVDRLAEIDEQEATERAGVRDQMELFRDAATNWRARRAAVETIYTRRLEEIDRLADVSAPVDPQPLGVLLIFPEA